jgi:hypothetical protein
MAIPTKKHLLSELVVFLGARSSHRAPCNVVYKELANYFPNVTHAERFDSYENSQSKWANRVQFARLLAVEEGLIYRDGSGPQPRRGVWILTDDGIQASQKWQSTTAVGQQQAAFVELQKQDRVKKDLLAFELEHEVFEGAKHQRLTSYYERRPELRTAAIAIHGTVCKVCKFDFGMAYGPHGQNFIEVHHLKPVSTLGKSVPVSPENDMTVLCANCHRMVHRNPDNPLTIDELKEIYQKHSAN